MAGRDDTGDETSGDQEAGQMLARRWVIAANYRSPGDYGIPTAPTFTAERAPDGTLVLFEAASQEPVLTSQQPFRVRR
ncbi:MAG: hypothetical protein ACI8XM_000785 [Haloarculaceae archaeon]|jgi:hypothetical protein